MNAYQSLTMCRWLALQVTVLFMQDFLGPRFFVPKQVSLISFPVHFIKLLPPRYDYHRPLRRTVEDPPECVICMSAIESSDVYMLAPCDHVFHEMCLTQWMEQKMECPTCRGALPIP